MGGFADQRDAMAAELSGLFDHKWKQMPSRFHRDTAENGMRLPFGRFQQFTVGQRHQPFGLAWRGNPHYAAAIAGQWHKYARPLRGVKFRRDISMGPRMADVKGHRGLIEVASPDLDARGLAAKRLPPIGAHHKAC